MSTCVKVVILLIIEAVTADVQVYFTNGIGQMVADFADMQAAFGDDIPPNGIVALVVYSKPDDACQPIEPPPRNFSNFTKHWAVLIKRHNCTFEEKVLAAQNATYDIVIVHNNVSDGLKTMHANHPRKLIVPSIFVSQKTGHIIKERYLYDQGFFIRITADSGMDFSTSMLIPFLVVISLCLLTMLGFLIVKYIKERRRAGRRRLPNSSLRKIPTAKFRKGDPYETCAICLDDYIEGEKLRILPCSHAYHSKCIDPWLTKNRRICPMCKRKVYAAGEPIPTDSDSASEDDDHTPLLRTAQTTTQGGTFNRALEALTSAPYRPGDLATLIHNYYQDNSSTSSSLHSESAGSGNRIEQPSNSASTPQSWTTPSRSALNGSNEDVNPFRVTPSTEDSHDVNPFQATPSTEVSHHVVI